MHLKELVNSMIIKQILLYSGGQLWDDVWINKNEELHIVDYKATAKQNFKPNF